MNGLPIPPNVLEYFELCMGAVIFLVVTLFAMRLRKDVQPIFVNIIGGVAKQASSNAPAYACAIGYGLSASLQALADQATALHWPIVAAACKVINPFIVACLAYAAQNTYTKKNGTTLKTETNPPFPPPTQ